jgi:hypothetical protein
MRRMWPLLLPILYYGPGIRGFPFSSTTASFSDVVISHLPNLLYLKQALQVWGVIPLWSPLVLSGTPFAANPLSGFWYPPGWLALLFAPPLGFNFLVIAHLLFGGYGVYRLLRVKGVGEQAALLAGVGFASLPKFAAHYGAGHLTLLYAVPWTPWLLWAWVAGPGRIRYRRAGLVLALIFLADVRWAAYAGGIGILWVFAHSRAFLEANDQLGRGSKAGSSGKALFRPVFGHLVLAAMLSAPLALPLWEFTRLTTRANLSAEDVLAFSLPPARLLGLVIPDFGGNPEWMLYPGGFIFALAFLVYFWPKARQAAIFWVWFLPLSLLYSLGEYLPGLSLLARVPGLSLLRVPPRALFLSGMALVILAAYAVDQIQGGLDKTAIRRGGLVLTALAGFALILAVGVRIITGAWLTNFLWGGIALVLALVWVLTGMHQKIPYTLWLLGILGLSLLDWGGVNQTLFAPRPSSQVFEQSRETAAYLAAQDLTFRTYSPSYSLPQQTSALAQLEMADGVDPLQLQAYAEFMVGASGVPDQGYSVTIPPYATGNPARDNAAYLPDPEQLGWLNVRYLLAEFDLVDQDLVLIDRFGSTRIYENVSFRPRAWVQASPGEVGSILRPAEISDWQPNQITLRAVGPGILVLSEIEYPGWEVRIDGQPADRLVISDLLRGVSLDTGEHEVAYQFRPTTVYLGTGLAVLALLFLFWGSFFPRHREKPPSIQNIHDN